MRLPVNTVIHTTLVSLEPATFRSLVRRATSSATEPTEVPPTRLANSVFVLGIVSSGSAIVFDV